MSLKETILSIFGNSLALSKHGSTEEMRERAAEEVKILESEHPGIRAEYAKRMEEAKNVRDSLLGSPRIGK